MVEGQLSLGLVDHFLAAGNRIRVLVKSVHMRARFQHRGAITAGTERTVNMRLAGDNGERVDHFVDQDRNMACGCCGGHFCFPPLFSPASFR